jgi:hypothetical protein
MNDDARFLDDLAKLPPGVDAVASFDLNRLATSRDILTLQKQADQYLAKRAHKSKWRSFTPRQALTEAGEAMYGIMDDAFGNTPGPLSLKTLVTKNDRLRGVGVLLVILALILLVVFF